MPRGKRKKQKQDSASAEVEPTAAQPGPARVQKRSVFKLWLEYYGDNPLMLLPLLVSILGGIWVLYNAYRPWVKVDGIVCSRTVTKYVQSDEDSYSEYFPAAISYLYDYGGREFTWEFEDDKIGDGFWSTSSYADAVVEARRWKIGDPVPLWVDSAHPEIATGRKPRVVLPLLGFVVCGGLLLLVAAEGRNSDEGAGCLFVLFTVFVAFGVYKTRIVASDEVDSPYSVRPYIEIMKAYPSLGYVPQNKIHEFKSFEQLLREWGRPDDLWVDDQDNGRRLTLTYRHGADWSQAWSIDFQIPEDGKGSPVPAGPPRQDNPQR